MNSLPVLTISIYKTRIAILVLLVTGFFGALALRISIGQPDVSHSAVAGILFACCLALLSIASGTKAKINFRILKFGLLGGAFLCIPAATLHSRYLAAHTPNGNYLTWSIIVAVVAFAEEAFLRGSLFDMISDVRNQSTAIIITAILFAAIHIPLYGLHSIPLDLTVGLWLGALRYQSGSFVAPGIAHIFADLAAWWII